MNYAVIRRILGLILLFESAFLLLPCMVAVIYREKQGLSYLAVAFICLVIGFLLTRRKTENQMFYAKEGFVIVALSWIVMSFFGAMPYYLSGDIPDVSQALFEAVSGFTTTGASTLSSVEVLSHCTLVWRAFTIWIGGMGVIVFLLAVLPLTGGYNMHLMRAESPGPSVGKLVPKVRETAKILYLIYISLTVIEIVLYILAGMPVFDAVTTGFSTAGTGGFGIRNDSMGSYSTVLQILITIFMILFGVNFNFYYFLLGKEKKEAFKMEEVRWYFTIIVVAALLIAVDIRGMFDNIGIALQQAFFQVGSIITTTGFSTIDFNLWPQGSKTILVLLTFLGACAGSTGGGIKVSRLMILVKSIRPEIAYFIHPRSVKVIKMDQKAIDKSTVRGVHAFFATYMMIIVVSVFLISFDGLDLVTNFTAVATAFNNVGPGLELVGPAGNFGCFSDFSHYVLMFDMLAGRLELYPILLLFTPAVWKKN